MSLTVVIYLCSYFMLFLGYIHLVCKQPEKKRAFTVPGGKTFKLLIAGVGFLVSLFAFVISFVPPSSLPGAHGMDVYISSLVVSFLIVAAIPFILYAVHDKQGQKFNAQLEHIKPHTIHSDHFFIHPRARSTHHVIVDGVNTTQS